MRVTGVEALDGKKQMGKCLRPTPLKYCRLMQVNEKSSPSSLAEPL